MRKILLMTLSFLFLVTGCSYEETMLNTPTKKVEMFFANYQQIYANVIMIIVLIAFFVKEIISIALILTKISL